MPYMILLTVCLVILVSILIWVVYSGIKKDGFKWKMPLSDKNSPIFKKETREEKKERLERSKEELKSELLIPIFVTGGILLIYFLFSYFGWA